MADLRRRRPLERITRRHEELQDLWLRCVIPLVTTITTMIIADVVVAMLAPRGQWWSHALVLAVVQFIGCAGVMANVDPLLGLDAALRRGAETTAQNWSSSAR